MKSRVSPVDVKSTAASHAPTLYLGQVGGPPDLPPQSFASGVDPSHMAPHPLPGLLIHREPSPVHVEGHPAIPQLLFALVLLLLVPLLHRAHRGLQHLSNTQVLEHRAVLDWTLFLHWVLICLQVWVGPNNRWPTHDIQQLCGTTVSHSQCSEGEGDQSSPLWLKQVNMKQWFKEDWSFWDQRLTLHYLWSNLVQYVKRQQIPLWSAIDINE